MITKYKLFENNKLNNPWSDHYIKKYPLLKKVYEKLDIVYEEGKHWVILHHFGSKDAYKPNINCKEKLKIEIEKLDLEYIENKIKKLADSNKLDFSLIKKFLNYPKFDLDLYHLNLLSKILGYKYFEDYCKEIYKENKENLYGELNPDFYGSGFLTKGDRIQLPYNVIMFYIDLKDKEKIFINKAYYKIKYPLEKIYPTFVNPYNINFLNLSDLIRKIKNYGFDGNIVN